MLSLCEEYYYYIKKGKILPINFLRRYIKFLSKRYNAKKYIKKIVISEDINDSEATYDFDLKIIAYYHNKIRISIEEDLNCSFDTSNFKHISLYNEKLLLAVTHECIHAAQAYVVDKYGDGNITTKILSDSISVHRYKPEIYLAHYDYFPMEINAEILGSMTTTNFINLLADEEFVFKNNKTMASEILELISDENHYISKTEVFYKIIEDEKRYYEIINNMDLSNYKRLILGLEIDNYFISELEQISLGKIEVDNVKRYLKSI